MTDIRPIYYKEYDEVYHTWNIFVSDSGDITYDFHVAEFEDQKVADSIVDCLNDVTMRCWNGKA